MTPTGTNLLGVVKHVASVESGYLGDCFGRPFGEPLPWFAEDAEPNADLWATADESRADIVAMYHRVWAHSDATIEALDLDALGHVPWWPEGRNHPTLHRLLIHMIAETHRHAGQLDIVRESIDGVAGLRAENDNLNSGEGGDAWWAAYRSGWKRPPAAAGARATAGGGSAAGAGVDGFVVVGGQQSGLADVDGPPAAVVGAAGEHHGRGRRRSPAPAESPSVTSASSSARGGASGRRRRNRHLGRRTAHETAWPPPAVRYTRTHRGPFGHPPGGERLVGSSRRGS
jgi:hypothetical protein